MGQGHICMGLGCVGHGHTYGAEIHIWGRDTYMGQGHTCGAEIHIYGAGMCGAGTCGAEVHIWGTEMCGAGTHVGLERTYGAGTRPKPRPQRRKPRPLSQATPIAQRAPPTRADHAHSHKSPAHPHRPRPQPLNPAHSHRPRPLPRSPAPRPSPWPRPLRKAPPPLLPHIRLGNPRLPHSGFPCPIEAHLSAIAASPAP